MNLDLELLAETFAVCRLEPAARIPEWARGPLVSISRSEHELSIVCTQNDVPLEVRQVRDWRCLRVRGPLDLSAVGILATLSRALAAADVSVLAIGTFDTDYLLVRQQQLEGAINALTADGHCVESKT